MLFECFFVKKKLFADYADNGCKVMTTPHMTLCVSWSANKNFSSFSQTNDFGTSTDGFRISIYLLHLKKNTNLVCFISMLNVKRCSFLYVLDFCFVKICIIMCKQNEWDLDK
jgi:hypothetical protein